MKKSLAFLSVLLIAAQAYAADTSQPQKTSVSATQSSKCATPSNHGKCMQTASAAPVPSAGSAQATASGQQSH